MILTFAYATFDCYERQFHVIYKLHWSIDYLGRVTMREDLEQELEEFAVYWRERRIPIIKESALTHKESEKTWLDFENSARLFIMSRPLSEEENVKYLEETERVQGEVSAAISQAKENFREKQNVRTARLLEYIVAGIIGLIALICITLRFL